MTRSHFFFSHAPHVLVVLTFACCAGQIPPSGGPADSTPPAIIRTEPDTNATRISPDRIVLEFSEYVDRRSAEESIFISPYVGLLEFDWSGTEVTILFDQQLRKNTTYVVNVGTDVVDIRARNRMAQGFTLAFSTGDSIDRGVISGKVFDDKPEGIMLFAYALSEINKDTLDPSRSKPDYIMQTGKDGAFAFSNIRYDTYRLFAVRDEYRNLIYDKQIDQIGVTTTDVTLSEKQPRIEGLSFRLFSEDTTKPFLTRVMPLSRFRLQLRFSEPLDTASFLRSHITLQDTVTRKQIEIVLRSLEAGDSTAAVVLTKAPLDSGRIYRLSVDSVLDRNGNIIDADNAQVDFAAVSTPDTTRPAVFVVAMRDSITGIPLQHVFEIRYSKPVDRGKAEQGLSLLDSMKMNVPVSFRWPTASNVLFNSQQPLFSKAWYTIRIVMDSVRDVWGNGYKDSVFTIRFQSLDLKSTGTIEGTVTDEEIGDRLGEIVLTVLQVQSQSRSEKTLRLREPGRFKVDQLPEGFYTLRAYRDRDSSGAYSFGHPFPFQSSERFVVFPDTVKVRARWGVESVEIKFKKTPGR